MSEPQTVGTYKPLKLQNLGFRKEDTLFKFSILSPVFLPLPRNEKEAGSGKGSTFFPGPVRLEFREAGLAALLLLVLQLFPGGEGERAGWDAGRGRRRRRIGNGIEVALSSRGGSEALRPWMNWKRDTKPFPVFVYIRNLGLGTVSTPTQPISIDGPTQISPIRTISNLPRFINYVDFIFDL